MNLLINCSGKLTVRSYGFPQYIRWHSSSLMHKMLNRFYPSLDRWLQGPCDFFLGKEHREHQVGDHRSIHQLDVPIGGPMVGVMAELVVRRHERAVGHLLFLALYQVLYQIYQQHVYHGKKNMITIFYWNLLQSWAQSN